MIGKEEDFTTGSLLDFNYFNKHYKLVAVDISKQKELDADLRANQQIELSIASYASVIDTPAGIAGSSLTLIFTIGTCISKSLLKVTKKRKKKHNKIIALAKNKLNMIDTLLSSALNDSEISHEEFTNIINEANIYENFKENITELTIEPSSLEHTKIYKSCAYKILIMTKITTCAYKILIMIKIITCAYKILLMIKIITCAYKILIMIKIITCAYKILIMIKIITCTS